MIDAKTTVCGIIGDPVEHSLSPAMHNSAYSALGLNWVYVAFRVKEVAAAVGGVRALGMRGVSVTIPHKVSVIPYLDQLDAVAEWIGSVNTIVNNNGVLLGLNTDGAGAMKALEEAGAPLAGKRVLIVGSGGAARAIAMTLAARAQPGGLTILGIVKEELDRLGRDVREKSGLNAEWGLLEEERLKRATAEAEVVIHCTPVGMHPEDGKTVIPADLFRPGLWVMDIVYNPHRTRLLREAAAAGCKVVYGREMLLHQGVLQFELWTGKKAPVEVMRRALEEELGKR